MSYTFTVSALFTIPCVALLPLDALAHTLMNVKWRHHRLKGLGVKVWHKQILGREFTRPSFLVVSKTS